ncbi:geranylgeranyl transferase type-1 subunit beta [Culicoides brevitarsis]|uniref:geranylgeranyl transferase type-1 subunit beta n=1 Tax=Culicoides brevitarsis TaxID=469753 RepID=UPI00307C6345
MSHEPLIEVKKHAKYFLRFLNLLPPRLASNDSTRVTIAFFAVSGLDTLNQLDLLSETEKQNIIDWIYHLQYVPAAGGNSRAGIQGSSILNAKDVGDCSGLETYKFGHLAMTYTGLAVLLALGDDLSRLNRKAIIEGVAAVQQNDGSFSPTLMGNEHDMRFVYCAACICYMLNDWSGVDVDKMVKYIRRSIRYDFGISQHDEMESHGGTTFCALAALELSGRLHELSAKEIERIKRWLVFRQEEGFNGRPNKPIDTCYSFWIAAALKILNALDLTDFKLNRGYLMSCQNTTVGGFSKWPGIQTDPFHSYFGLCGLSFLNEPGLLPIMPGLNISMRSHERLKKLHEKWAQ